MHVNQCEAQEVGLPAIRSLTNVNLRYFHRDPVQVGLVEKPHRYLYMWP
jgi:hypothetical protein